MTSPITNFMSSVETAIEALTPPVDGTGVQKYRRVGESGLQGGASQHRLFTFMPSLRQKWQRGTAGAPVISYNLRLVFWNFQQGRTSRKYALDLVEEIALITRWWIGFGAYGAGIDNALLGPESTFDEGQSRIVWPFFVTSQEI